MKHKNSHLLVGYWSRIRNGRPVPDQTDIDPRAIKRLLAHTFILDMRDAAHPVYRLAGTGMCDYFGFELKGTGFLSMWETQSRHAIASLLRQALRLNMPVSISSIASTTDCGMIELETVLAPISFNGTEPTRFVGLVQVVSDVSKLAGRPIAFQRLVDSQIVFEDEPLSTFSAVPPPPVRQNAKGLHLRLVAPRGGDTQPHQAGSYDLQAMMRKIVEAFDGSQDNKSLFRIGR